MSRLPSAEWILNDVSGTMAPIMALKPFEEDAYRMVMTREALGISQAELCRRADIGAAAWNNVETGDNRIGLDTALKLCATFGLTLDWIYRAQMHGGLPTDIAEKIAQRMKRDVSRKA